MKKFLTNYDFEDYFVSHIYPAKKVIIKIIEYYFYFIGLVTTSLKSISISSNSNSRTDKYVNLTSIDGKFYQLINKS